MLIIHLYYKVESTIDLLIVRVELCDIVLIHFFCICLFFSQFV
jgi:hypothetical protein